MYVEGFSPPTAFTIIIFIPRFTECSELRTEVILLTWYRTHNRMLPLHRICWLGLLTCFSSGYDSLWRHLERDIEGVLLKVCRTGNSLALLFFLERRTGFFLCLVQFTTTEIVAFVAFLSTFSLVRSASKNNAELSIWPCCVAANRLSSCFKETFCFRLALILVFCRLVNRWQEQDSQHRLQVRQILPLRTCPSLMHMLPLQHQRKTR